MVSILLSFPVLVDGSIRYLSVPLGYRLWDKKQTKLEIAAGMVRHAMDNIGPDRQVFLLCDSWYPKGCAAGLVNEYQNLDIICSARIDTVMYSLPPERTGKRGRPKKYGERLSPEDFELGSPKTGDWKISVRPVLTRLWGNGRSMPLSRSPKAEMVAAGFFSAPKTRKASLWITAGAKMVPCVDMGKKTDSSCRLHAALCAGILKYHTTKAKHSGHLEEYRVRSREGIERLINLENIAYSAMTLLPYSEEFFSCYQSASAQETRFGIGEQIQASIIFGSFVKKLETVKKSCVLIKIIENYIQSGFKNVQNL